MRPRHRPLAVLAVLPLVIGACALRPSEMSAADHIVAVKSVRLPSWQPWVSRFAEHTFFDIKRPGGWQRVEVLSRSSGVVVRSIADELAVGDERWSRPVHLIDCLYGAAAERAATAIVAAAKRYPYAGEYQAWPGPNSNTFADWLVRRIPELSSELYPSALGADYIPFARVGLTSTGTGVEFETVVLGVELGLREGVELHVPGLTLGVGLWPPSLKLPFLAPIPGGY